MKRRILSAILLLCIMITLSGTAFADQTQKAAVLELYSVDGYYQNSLGNQSNYSYHVPQLNADSSAAKEINDEIGERFGSRVEAQFKSMEGGYSLWTWHTEWQSFWNGSQIFLFITLLLPMKMATVMIMRHMAMTLIPGKESQMK